MKTILKDIKEQARYNFVTDVTDWKTEDLYKLHHDEQGFNSVAYSTGTYGLNGLIVQGYKSGKLYAVTQRTNAIFILA